MYLRIAVSWLVALFSLKCSAFLLNGGVKPNIIFLVADDLGFADVGFRNGDIISPNIDTIAKEGVILDSSYVQPTCSPSRTAMLTGRYPFKLGMQSPISMDEKQCLPLNETLLPERLQRVGYKTHAIGKWHLGYCNSACVPTRRGFDTFYGIYGGSGDKSIHRVRSSDRSFAGFDFRENEQAVTNVRGQYSTDLYGQRAVEVINNHGTSDPMFMWLSFQNVHAPVTVPDRYVKMYPGVDSAKAAYYGMVTIMDEYIGKIVAALKAKKMYDNTLLIFTTDNGGKVANGANNYPLRGEKVSLYEGGTRGVTIIDGPMLNKRGYVNEGLFHAIDWTPTILHFVEGTAQTDAFLDGVDQFDMLYQGGASRRTEFIYALTNNAAIRDGDYKLITGRPGGQFADISPRPTTPNARRKRRAVRQGNRSRSIRRRARQTRRTRRNGKPNRPFRLNNGNDSFTRRQTAGRGGRGGRGGRVRPGGRGGKGGQTRNGLTLLFNIKNDPGETTDLSTANPDIVQRLQAKLNAARPFVVDQIKPVDTASNPANFAGFWSPGWC